MTRLALPLLLAVVGCADSDDAEYPVEPTEDDYTTPTGSTGSTPGMLSGRICISNSISNLSQCRQNDLEGFTVEIGGQSATTDTNGNFEVPAPTGSLLSFTVSGPGAVTTTTPYSPSTTLPVIDADVYARAMASHQIFASEGQGAILGTVMRQGQPARDITVTSDPLGSFSPFYDTDGPGLGVNATGARGVFWVPGLATGAAGLTFRDAAGAETTVAGIQVVNGGVTILDSVAM
jgi:hypothetical protein